MNPPSRAERRALHDALLASLRAPGTSAQIGEILHWLAHTEELLLRTGACLAAWPDTVPALDFDEAERLGRDLQQVRALSGQLAELWTHGAAQVLAAPPETSVWHEWLHLILAPLGGPASAERAAGLAALDHSYRQQRDRLSESAKPSPSEASLRR